jgi:hypothetical protein
MNQYLATSGSTTTVVQTNATQADGFWDGQILIVRDSTGEVVARRVESYASTNGAFTLGEDLPFTPTTNDRCIVVPRAIYLQAILDGVPDAVWDEARAGHVAAGTFGEYIDDMIAIGIESRFNTLDVGQGVINSAVGAVGGTVDLIAVDTGVTIPGLLNNIAVTGSAVNTIAESYVLTRGTQVSGTFVDTQALDGVEHQHEDVTGELDLYYQFSIGGDGVPTGAEMIGRLTGNNDDLEVYAFNWGGSTWDRIGTVEGRNSSTNRVHNFTLLTSHVGAGANIGIVRIRFFDGAFTLSGADLYIDQLIVSYSIANRSVGYDDGAIWIDTNGGVSGTESFVNGTADNPVDTLADALTLATNLNLVRFHVLGNSSIALVADTIGKTFIADNLWSLALGSQEIEGTSFQNADVSGVATSSGAQPTFEKCHLGTVTLPPCRAYECGLAVGVTAGAAGDFFFSKCDSNVAGTGTPFFDFGALIGDVNANFRSYSGGIEVRNFNASGVDTMSLEGNGQLIIAASCTGGTIALRGNFDVTDNSGGAVTIVQAWDSLSDIIWSDLSTGSLVAGSFGQALKDVLDLFSNRSVVTENGDGSKTIKFYRDDASTVFLTLEISVDGLERTV